MESPLPRVYSKTALLALSQANASAVRPNILKKDFDDENGLWSPETWIQHTWQVEGVESRAARRRNAEREHRSAHRGIKPDALDIPQRSTLAGEPHQSLVLSPQRRSFAAGASTGLGRNSNNSSNNNNSQSVTGETTTREGDWRGGSAPGQRGITRSTDMQSWRGQQNKPSWAQGAKSGSAEPQPKPTVASDRQPQQGGSSSFDRATGMRGKTSDYRSSNGRSAGYGSQQSSYGRTSGIGRGRVLSNNNGSWRQEGSSYPHRSYGHGSDRFEQTPEWMDEGPESMLDTIELHGFDEENGSSPSTNARGVDDMRDRRDTPHQHQASSDRPNSSSNNSAQVSSQRGVTPDEIMNRQLSTMSSSSRHQQQLGVDDDDLDIAALLGLSSTTGSQPDIAAGLSSVFGIEDPVGAGGASGAGGSRFSKFFNHAEHENANNNNNINTNNTAQQQRAQQQQLLHQQLFGRNSATPPDDNNNKKESGSSHPTSSRGGGGVGMLQQLMATGAQLPPPSQMTMPMEAVSVEQLEREMRRSSASGPSGGQSKNMRASGNGDGPDLLSADEQHRLLLQSLNESGKRAAAAAANGGTAASTGGAGGGQPPIKGNPLQDPKEQQHLMDVLQRLQMSQLNNNERVTPSPPQPGVPGMPGGMPPMPNTTGAGPMPPNPNALLQAMLTNPSFCRHVLRSAGLQMPALNQRLPGPPPPVNPALGPMPNPALMQAALAATNAMNKGMRTPMVPPFGPPPPMGQGFNGPAGPGNLPLPGSPAWLFMVQQLLQQQQTPVNIPPPQVLLAALQQQQAQAQVRSMASTLAGLNGGMNAGPTFSSAPLNAGALPFTPANNQQPPISGTDHLMTSSVSSAMRRPIVKQTMAGGGGQPIDLHKLTGNISPATVSGINNNNNHNMNGPISTATTTSINNNNNNNNPYRQAVETAHNMLQFAPSAAQPFSHKPAGARPPFPGPGGMHGLGPNKPFGVNIPPAGYPRTAPLRPGLPSPMSDGGGTGPMSGLTRVPPMPTNGRGDADINMNPLHQMLMKANADHGRAVKPTNDGSLAIASQLPAGACAITMDELEKRMTAK